MSTALISRTKKTTTGISGIRYHHLKNGGLVTEALGLWPLYSSHQAWLDGATPTAKTQTEPTNEFFRRAP